MVEKEIVLVPVVQEDGKLIGVVARLDILRQKLNEGFVTIGERRSEIAKTYMLCHGSLLSISRLKLQRGNSD